MRKVWKEGAFEKLVISAVQFQIEFEHLFRAQEKKTNKKSNISL